jgi:putative two-component system response regulator
MAEASTVQHGRDFRILVADDESAIRTYLHRLLEQEGFAHVIEARDGREAGQRLGDRLFDLAFLDVVMPGCSGRNVASQALRENPELVVIMMSGFPTISEAVELMKIGSWDFLFKPLSIRRVTDALNAAVHRRVELFVPPGAREIIHGLVRVLEGKDRFQAGHGARVSRLCRHLGGKIGMSTRDRELLTYAALAHDVGKVRVPQDVLNKTGPLTPRERRLIEGHPAHSAEILESASALTEALPWVRAHHERPDGCGYPDGLPVAAIPVHARLIAVADSYDAMRYERGYRAAMSHEEACGELMQVRGTQLDSDLVELLISCLAEEEIDLWSTDRVTEERVHAGTDA